MPHPPIVLINTRNRKDETRRAIRSVLAQTVPARLLVIDDASTDGTSDMVRGEFPQAILVTNQANKGVLTARNEGARIALDHGTPVLFVLDDDAEFSTPRVIEQTLACLDHPRVGAVAIPLVNFVEGTTNDPDKFLEKCDAPFAVTFQFRGGASMMRADLFLALGGYRGHGGYAEEGNYCARMLDAGYVTRAGSRIDAIHHYPSPNRNPSGITRQKAVNNVLFAWHNVPMPQYLIHAPGTSVNMVKYGLRQRHLGPAISGVWQGWIKSVADLPGRRPMSRASYRLMRRLIRAGCVPFESIEGQLPPRRAIEGVPEL